MGGVPVLLLVAALGVDYGWQPDGGDGVEYVIQVSPDQWDRVQELGEISSVIDPAVQGRVSRVIIRVGNERLPRVTPPPRPTSSQNSQRRSDSSANELASGDLVPMPIPEMTPGQHTVAIPGGRVASAAQPSNAAVMKPDPNQAGQNGGYTLPPSLQEAAAGVSGAVRGAADQVTDELANAAQSQFDAAMNQLRNNNAAATNDRRAAAPSTAPAADEPPPFTGGDATGGVARTRPGGPSTEPTTATPGSWYPLGTARETAQSSTTPPTTRVEPPAAAASAYQPPAYSSTQYPTTPQNAPPSAQADQPANGFGNNFGRVPDSLRGQSADPAYAAAPNYPADQRATPPTATNANGYTPPPYSPPAATPNPALDGFRYSQQAPQYAQQPPVARSAEPDPRLQDRAGVAPEMFGYNAQGLPLDRDGKPVGAAQYSTPYDPRLSDAYTAEANRSGFPARDSATANARPTTSLGLPSSNRGGEWPDPRDTRDPRVAASADLDNPATRTREARGRERDEDSFLSSSDLADTRNSRVSPPAFDATSATPGSIAPRHTVAAQPFFNGLLLLSIVANFYLIFWLKNLRHQFRDLVAAKRMAQSSGSV